MNDDRDTPGEASESEPADTPGTALRGIVDGEEHEVDPRSVTVARLVAISTVLGAALVPLGGVTLAWALGGVPSYVYLPLFAGWIVLIGAALVWAYRWPELRHRHLRYRVDESGVRIRRGVLWRKVVSIPTSRVQHTDVSQGPVQRRFELATLTVYTAGTEGASIGLEGLEQGVAERLRDHLLPDHEDGSGAADRRFSDPEEGGDPEASRFSDPDAGDEPGADRPPDFEGHAGAEVPSARPRER